MDDLPDYRKVAPKQFPPRSQKETPEGRHWQGFKDLGGETKLAGAVTHVEFCATKPFDCAVTTSTRVVVFDSATGAQKRAFSRFKDVAYGGSFRSDGKLLVVGGESGIVQVFDSKSRTILRQLKGHKGAVHCAHFAKDKIHVVSGGDDGTFRLWDMAAQSQVASLRDHTDYVRSAAVSPASEDVWATGSYDHTVRLWDARANRTVLTIQHSHPVEHLAFFPSAGILAVAGGPSVGLYDTLSSGRLLHSLGSHQKTVTSVVVARPFSLPAGLSQSFSSGQPNLLPAESLRILTGSLDGHVKVFDADTFKMTHSSSLPSPVLSLSLSPHTSCLAIGMSSGLFTMRKKQTKQEEEVGGERKQSGLPSLGEDRKKERHPTQQLRANSYKYFIRGQSERAAAEDFLVAQQRRVNLAAHEKLLRKFQFREALSSALDTRHPQVVTAVLEELVAQSALMVALSHRDTASLLPLLSYMAKYATSPRHSALLLPIVHCVLSLYSPHIMASKPLYRQVLVLRDKLRVELRAQKQLLSLQGMIQPLIQASIQ